MIEDALPDLVADDCPLDYLAVPGTDIIKSLAEFCLDAELDSLRCTDPSIRDLVLGGGIDA